MSPRAPVEQFGLPAHNAPARAHLAWLLDSFVYADIDAMPLARRYALRRALQGAISSASSHEWIAEETYESAAGAKRFTWQELRAADPALRRPADPTADLREAQVRAKAAVEPLSRGDYYTLDVGAASIEVGGPPLNTYIYMPLADAVVGTIITAMSLTTPFSAIRRCPYVLPDGSECGRVFVAVRAQQWCRPHGLARRREQNRAALEKHRSKRAAKRRRRTR